jgi:hypothetical protein
MGGKEFDLGYKRSSHQSTLVANGSLIGYRQYKIKKINMTAPTTRDYPK